MSNLTRKEISEEITNAIGGSRVADWNDLVTIMGKLTAGNYRDQEMKDTWKVMDKRERGVVSYQDFKTHLQSHIAVPISEYEIRELCEAAEIDVTTGITYQDFVSMLNL